jgi:hypothetical protein
MNTKDGLTHLTFLYFSAYFIGAPSRQYVTNIILLLAWNIGKKSEIVTDVKLWRSKTQK